MPETASPTSGSEEFGDTSQRERQLHKEAFNDDEELRKAIRRAERVEEIEEGVPKGFGGNSFYKPTASKISYKPRESASESRKRLEWRHEYGHHLDDTVKPDLEISPVRQRIVRNSIREEADDVVRNTADPYADATQKLRRQLSREPLDVLEDRASQAGLNDDFIELVRRRDNPEGILSELIAQKETDNLDKLLHSFERVADGAQIEDLFGSLTETEIGGGHTKSYYDGNEIRQASEMWADYIGTRGMKNDAARRQALDILEEYAPKTKNALDSILKDMADGNL
jgi:hypothetical protein